MKTVKGYELNLVAIHNDGIEMAYFEDSTVEKLREAGFEVEVIAHYENLDFETYDMLFGSIKVGYKLNGTVND